MKKFTMAAALCGLFILGASNSFAGPLRAVGFEAGYVIPEERALLDRHATFVREMETDLASARERKLDHPMPPLEAGAAPEKGGDVLKPVSPADLLPLVFRPRVSLKTVRPSVRSRPLRPGCQAFLTSRTAVRMPRTNRSIRSSTPGTAHPRIRYRDALRPCASSRRALRTMSSPPSSTSMQRTATIS